MEAFPHFITSGLCCLHLDLGQKGLQNLLGAYSVISGAWPLSRVRVGHAVASFGASPFHAVASVMRPRHVRSTQGARSRQSCGRVAADLCLARDRVIHAIAWIPISLNLRFTFSFYFCMFPFPSFKSFCLRKSETTQHTNYGIEWK